MSENPDIIGFANYVWNRQLNLKIGQYLKSKLPNTLFVAGGPNIDVDESGQKAFLRRYDFLDFVITNSGEEPFSELVNWWRNGQKDYNKLPENLVWLENDLVRKTPERKITKKVQGIPSPYLNGQLDEFLEMGMIPLFETNRGCPFACTFCAWGMSAQNLVRQFDIGSVFEEIEYVADRSDAVYWIVCDANFGMLKRDVEIAKAIRSVKDKKGLPEKCHVWLAKNATERNLEIGGILDDMVVPVMAVQSLDDEVLKEIKRSNISTETYRAYQQKFHEMGSVTYADVIIPLPSETLDSHIRGLGQLFEMGVSRIQNHNTWLLPGTELNLRETWSEFGFKTKRRLIHGDAGKYIAPNGDVIRVFEYEESLRETTTMSQEDMFYLRKFHFLIDFCWSLNVYKPLLKFGLDNGFNPNDVFKKMIDLEAVRVVTKPSVYQKVAEFWQRYEKASREEWFDTDEDIEQYFAKNENFERLINQEFEKLHIQFSMIIFKEYKPYFDEMICEVMKSLLPGEKVIIHEILNLVSKMFPNLNDQAKEYIVTPSDELLSHSWLNLNLGERYRGEELVRFFAGNKRKKMLETIDESKGKTLSKVLNTGNLSVRELKYDIDTTFGLGKDFKKILEA